MEYTGSEKRIKAIIILMYFPGILDINTKGTDSTHIVTIGSKTVVMSCLRGDGWKLVRYNLKNGAEVDSASLQRSPDGLAEVHMSSKDCVAVAYGYVLNGTMWNFKKYIDERLGLAVLENLEQEGRVSSLEKSWNSVIYYKRKHSSRLRTVLCRGRRAGGGGCASCFPGGVCAQGDVCPWGGLCPGPDTPL